MELTIGLAFAAGLISFISPCVLPLVPAYITYMGGRMTRTVAATAGGGTVTSNNALLRINTGLHSLFFVLGFSLVFVGIGLLSTAFISQIQGREISTLTTIIGRAGGIVIIAFGIHFMDGISSAFNQLRKHPQRLNILFSLGFALIGATLIFWAFDRTPSIFDTNTNIFNRLLISLPIFTAFIMWLLLGGAFTAPRAFWLGTFTLIERALYADTRQQLQPKQGNGFGSSVLMGIVFAAGWTPCIGPIYGAILTLAANGGSVSQAGSMLLAYSLGLGIPFIMTALLLDSAQGTLRRLNRHMRTIKLVSGSFLVLIGLLVASGQLQRISALGAQGEFAIVSFRMEECFTHAVTGDVPWGQVIPCMQGNYSLEGLYSGGSASLPTLESATQPLVASAPTTTETSVSVGSLAPDFSTFTPTGEAVNLSDYRGQVVLLNFWATWCGPCRIEMPEFQAAYNEHGTEGFVVVAVNNQETAQQVRDYAEQFKLTFPILMDGQGDIQQQYGILQYPSTFIIGRDGTILSRHFGAINRNQISTLIAEALAS